DTILSIPSELVIHPTSLLSLALRKSDGDVVTLGEVLPDTLITRLGDLTDSELICLTLLLLSGQRERGVSSTPSITYPVSIEGAVVDIAPVLLDVYSVVLQPGEAVLERGSAPPSWPLSALSVLATTSVQEEIQDTRSAVLRNGAFAVHELIEWLRYDMKIRMHPSLESPETLATHYLALWGVVHSRAFLVAGDGPRHRWAGYVPVFDMLNHGSATLSDGVCMEGVVCANSQIVVEDSRVVLKATADIPARTPLLIDYSQGSLVPGSIQSGTSQAYFPFFARYGFIPGRTADSPPAPYSLAVHGSLANSQDEYIPYLFAVGGGASDEVLPSQGVLSLLGLLRVMGISGAQCTDRGIIGSVGRFFPHSLDAEFSLSSYLGQSLSASLSALTDGAPEEREKVEGEDAQTQYERVLYNQCLAMLHHEAHALRGAVDDVALVWRLYLTQGMPGRGVPLSAEDRAWLESVVPEAVSGYDDIAETEAAPEQDGWDDMDVDTPVAREVEEEEDVEWL
ncbi:hypothetical protein KIPB_005743, partial [Kipferlia bialata]